MAIRFSMAFLVLASIALIGCDPKKSSNGNGGSKDDTPTKIGTVIGITTDIRPAATPDPTPNPVTVPFANVVVLRKLDVSPEVDGAIKWIGVETDEATAAKLGSKNVLENPRDKKIYRRLSPGEIVKRGQVIAWLDDEQAFLQWKAADAKAAAAKASSKAYEVTVTKLQEIVTQTADGVARGIIPKQELLNSQATLARYQADLVEHQGSASVAAEEAATAKNNLEKRTLRAAVDGEVQQVLKHEGEGVKAQEPMLVIQDFGTLRAIGNLPKEYANSIFRGDEVKIEVPRDEPPAVTFEQHTTNKPIVAVAVGMANGKPVIISVGEDGWVYAWDRELKVLAAGKSPAGVRSLAVTRPGIEPALALVGGVDGTARLYNLSTPSPANKPIREFKGRHEGEMTAAAFSADGKYCVTADERGIYMYDVLSGEKKYDFPTREHHSPITSLSFTPQGRVVSAGREPSIRVWVVGTDAVRVEHQIDSRSGDVTMPGVTDDGSRLLLDADKGHLDVIHLQDLRKERPLVTAGESGRFSTFTCWSPDLSKSGDDRRIATTGGADGVVQLWNAPTAKDRGTEVARFVTRGGAAATCAAFCPVGKDCFLVVGTQKGVVHLWPLPAADAQAEVTATVTHIDPAIESSGRTVNVLVDFDNPKIGDTRNLLRPGAAVTLVIRPKK